MLLRKGDKRMGRSLILGLPLSRRNCLSILIFVAVVVMLLLLPMSQADVMDSPFESPFVSPVVYLPMVRH